jgi:hypothetical protein
LKRSLRLHGRPEFIKISIKNSGWGCTHAGSLKRGKKKIHFESIISTAEKPRILDCEVF